MNRFITSCVAVWLGVSVAWGGELRFARVISDHAVLQREIEVPVWGWGKAGAEVKVFLNGREVGRTIADREGRWEVRLPAQKANAKGSELVAVSGGERVKREDVLFGDVWFGCGQSNMAYTFNGIGREPVGGAEFVAGASNRLIRTLKMNVEGNKNAGIPREDAGENVRWRVSDPSDAESVKNFSAALYWFGDKLQREIGVPVGLVDASWGATKIDGWIDGDYCREHGEGRAKGIGGWWVDRRENFLKAGGAEWYEKAIVEWNEVFNPGANALPALHEVGFDDSGWADVTLPGTGFQHAPFPTNMVGEVWMRTKVVLDEEDLNARYKFASSYGVGKCFGNDLLYVNGHAVGGSGNPKHGYGFPLDRCVVGTNVVVVQLKVWAKDGEREGGMHQAPVLYLRGRTKEVPLTQWKAAIPKRVPRPYNREDAKPDDARSVNMFSATSMHNGLVRPLYPMGIRGAIWYQGCSDLGNGEYPNFFRGLVGGWRANFAHGDRPLPVIVTEIAPHKLDTNPNSLQRIERGETAVPTWSVSADVRRMLNELGESVPDCGTVSLLDLGEEDIHPVRKEEVAERWVRWALAKVYGRSDVVPSGPVVERVEWQGAKAIVHLRNAKGLKTSDGKPVFGFELAGPVTEGLDNQDSAKAKPKEGYLYHAASATIVGETVVVTCPRVTEACALRYAWFDLNLGWNVVNGEGLPLGTLHRYKEGGWKPQVYETK